MRCRKFCCGLSNSKILSIALTTVFLGLLFQYKDISEQYALIRSKHTCDWSSSLLAALACQASQNKTILLALVDLGAYEMTMNFYETSIVKHGIQNYLFLSTNVKMCELLTAKDIYCLSYSSDADSNKSSMFGTKEFIRKMNIRTYMILDALEMGYNVLHTDVDMIYIRNPFLDLPCLNGSCDVAIMWDSDDYNAGFLFIRSSKSTIELYKDMRKTAEKTKKNDQLALNDGLRKLKKKLKVVKLSEKKYSCGKNFYEKPGRHFGDDPSINKTEVVVVHNNWIVSLEAKAYRFKEMLQWNYDEYGYYSSKTAKYISYENPLLNASTGNESRSIVWSKEKEALQNALMIGALLNRSVILPKFHCGKKLCTLLNWIKIRNFEIVFKNKYRENLFLNHYKVPVDISSSLSQRYLIENSNVESSTVLLDDAIQHKPLNEVNGPSASEILDWYGHINDSVLRFKSLFGDFKLLQNLSYGTYSTSIEAFEEAFVGGGYRQF